ncbi:hypothetical protein [Bacillus cereus]|nr:hypothetical protein [Bacillus cereus]
MKQLEIKDPHGIETSSLRKLEKQEKKVDSRTRLEVVPIIM